MRRLVNRPVAVEWLSRPRDRRFFPMRIYWDGAWHDVPELFLGFHHTYGERDALRHVWEVCTDGHWFRLVLDPRSLIWTLEIVADD